MSARFDGGSVHRHGEVAVYPGASADLGSSTKNVHPAPGLLISEMVPVKQSVKNWTEMVTVQVFYGLKATPDQFKARIESGLAAACPKSESRPVAQGEENGYPSMVWLQNCPLNKATGKPEITWFKAIQGNDSFYIVQVAFKAWPSKEQITQWMRYLKDATVCDTRLPDRACVAPGAGGPR